MHLSCGEKLLTSFPPRGSAKQYLLTWPRGSRVKRSQLSSLHLKSLAHCVFFCVGELFSVIVTGNLRAQNVWGGGGSLIAVI